VCSQILTPAESVLTTEKPVLELKFPRWTLLRSDHIIKSKSEIIPNIQRLAEKSNSRSWRKRLPASRTQSTIVWWTDPAFVVIYVRLVGRLLEDDYSLDDVMKIIQSLSVVVKSSLQSELIRSAQQNVALLMNLMSQAEKRGVWLDVDPSALDSGCGGIFGPD
jgi:hypothetical protein